MLEPNELLRAFKKKYGQLSVSNWRFLDDRKVELFLQAIDEALEDRLLMLLEDKDVKGGFTTD